jgi:hypothetical protein
MSRLSWLYKYYNPKLRVSLGRTRCRQVENAIFSENLSKGFSSLAIDFPENGKGAGKSSGLEFLFLFF